MINQPEPFVGMIQPAKQLVRLESKPKCFFAEVLISTFYRSGVDARSIKNNWLVVGDAISAEAQLLQIVENQGRVSASGTYMENLVQGLASCPEFDGSKEVTPKAKIERSQQCISVVAAA